ncbi:alpha/beta hydrolase [Pseudoxanthomonas sp.]|uniref:alpha/beta hydrolase n=1 Tax=Pseudoxanthomonas sp. TaxID=1871049 RepID=UPI0028C41A07|nr:alpha/beta hydrolase [Pseudoxanthomonas sp.]
MLLSRPAAYAAQEHFHPDPYDHDLHQDDVAPQPPPPIVTPRWRRAVDRLAGLLVPQRAARRGLARLDAETAFAGCPGHVDGLTARRETLSLRGRRLQLAFWGDPQRQPYVLIPPQDAVGREAMAAWIRALRGAGYAVVAFAREQRGTPRTSTVLELTNDMLEVARRCGEADAVIGHSLGAMSVALALHQGLRAKRAILISAQADPRAALQRFVDRAGIGSRAGGRMLDLIEARIGQGLDALQAHRIAPAIGVPVLVVHDLLDDEVPWHEGERFARHLSAARLLTTLDLGHHGVLADAAVLRDCLRFLDGATVGDKVVSSQNLPYGVA